ncbi:MAG: tRNA (adenosine(37)-N6)-dimethylallyltransferase MiaA [Bacteroidetes bacterium]|nr:tRNA (adenosine(37)-N6)-dimethylallyltransferase MiaA [Bacteroidota bacterium]
MDGHVIVIGGPTASGKTALAIQIAKKLGTEIISADSRQVYRELNIGVARPSELELSEVPHHFIADRSITDNFNAGKFSEEGRQVLDSLISKNGTAVVCGGTGLYIRALLYGLDALPEINTEIRNKVSELWKAEGLKGIQKELLAIQPNAADLLALDNPARVQRALELVWSTGLSLDAIWAKKESPVPYQIHGYYLNPERKKLYSYIDQRTAEMFQNGLISEAEGLQKFRHFKALQTVGYSEVFEYLEAKISLEITRQKVAQHTRNYAKRQLTWFRNTSGFQAISPESAEDIIFDTLNSHGYSIH